jgi:hypothetical protein
MEGKTMTNNELKVFLLSLLEVAKKSDDKEEFIAFLKMLLEMI